MLWIYMGIMTSITIYITCNEQPIIAGLYISIHLLLFLSTGILNFTRPIKDFPLKYVRLKTKLFPFSLPYNKSTTILEYLEID